MNKYISIFLGLFLMGMVSCTQNDLPITEEQIELEHLIENEIETPSLRLDDMDSPEKTKLEISALKTDFVPVEQAIK